MSFIDKLNDVTSDEVKKVFKELITAYMHPAYGSMSKRDFDIFLFMKLQSLGIIDTDPDLYDIVANLKVTRTKARNLLYESKMRSSSKEMLNNELKNLLSKPIFLKDNDKIAIEISNPLLADHLRSQLKKLGYITDGSFSAELIKMSMNAYLAIFEYMIPKDSKKHVIDALILCGAKEPTDFKKILTSILKTLGSIAIGKAGEESVKYLFTHLTPLINAQCEKITNLYKNKDFFDTQKG